MEEHQQTKDRTSKYKKCEVNELISPDITLVWVHLNMHSIPTTTSQNVLPARNENVSPEAMLGKYDYRFTAH